MEHNKAIIASMPTAQFGSGSLFIQTYLNTFKGLQALSGTVESCLDYMEDHSTVETYIGRAVKNPSKHTNLIDEAVQQVREETGLLVLPSNNLRYQPQILFKVIDLFGIHALNKVRQSHIISINMRKNIRGFG